MNNQRVREEPRISVNKLGEYLIAGPQRRRAIVNEQKRPSDFRVIYYQHASNMLTQFIHSGRNNYDMLIEGSNQLIEQSSTNNSDYETNRCLSNAEAIDCFSNICDDLPLDITDINIGPSDPPKITISNVEISIRPELILTNQIRGNQTQTGVLKFYFSKGLPLGETAGQYITALLYQYTEQYFSEHGNPNLNLAILVDVFAGEFYIAPRNYRRRMLDIEAACSEISLIWPTV